MTTFNCGEHTYLIKFTIGRLERVIDLTGVDLADYKKCNDWFELLGNQKLYAEALWILIGEPDGKSEFLENVDDSVLMQSWEAVLEANENFTHPHHRAAREAIIEKTADLRLKAQQMLTKKMDAVEVDKMLSREVDRVISETMTEVGVM